MRGRAVVAGGDDASRNATSSISQQSESLQLAVSEIPDVATTHLARANDAASTILDFITIGRKAHLYSVQSGSHEPI